MRKTHSSYIALHRDQLSSTLQCGLLFRRSLLCASISVSLAFTQAHANPTGGNVVAGSAAISLNGQQLDIHQESHRAIINWQNFNIGDGHVTQFHQQSSSAAVLNRVTSGDPSQIFGTLRANGHIYLVNPNGIVVGKNGRVDTHSFVASTMDVTNAEFLSGGDMAFTGSSDSAVVNLGQIDAVGGDVFLIAHKVLNEGNIKASGEVGLAAGTEVLLSAAGDKRISVRLMAKNARIDQRGLIESAKAQLAAVGNNPYALAINHDGITRATGVEKRNGRILLSAESGATRIAGELTAAGGDVHVLGNQVDVVSGALINVSSDTKGGEILVGGNLQGQGPQQNALNTSIEAGAELRADALVIGDGGSVIVWSDEISQVSGRITARGGMYGGDGGFIETSAKKDLILDVDIDASAPKGSGGQWLIDPESITIDRTMADNIEKALDNDTSVLVTTYKGWPKNNNVSTTEADTELISSTSAAKKDETNLVNLLGESDNSASGPAHITVDAAITKRLSDQNFSDIRTLQAMADVAKGAFVENLNGNEDPVLLLRKEANKSGDFNVVEQTIKTRLEAAALAMADSETYQIKELTDDVKVVWQIERDVAENSSVPTLELLSRSGNIYVNEAITSVNGQLNIVLNAGGRENFTNRNEGVYVNADILTNGGSLLMRGGGVIDVADNVLISTRDVFGGDKNQMRFLASDDEAKRQLVFRNNRLNFTDRNPDFTSEDLVTVPAEQLMAPWQNSAASKGWSGDIMMMVDKNIGYSNFFLFYRSDLSYIRIGENTQLLANADRGREGSIRMLSLANLTDLFESSGWLGVRNYAQSSITIGDGARISGGVIDLIADARSDADVGSVIEAVTRELADATDEAGLEIAVAVNNESEVLTAGENISQMIMDISSSGKDINSEMEENGVARSPSDLTGGASQAKLPIAQLGKLAVKHIDEVPFIGEILSLSPIAIAIAETDAQITVGSNVQIRGGDRVTVSANAESSATGSSVAPGLALSLTVTNGNSDINIGSGSEILSLGNDNLGASLDPLVTGRPFLAFNTTGYFGLSRQYLNERSTTDSLLISANTSTSSFTKASSGALTSEIATSILQSSEEARAKKAGDATQTEKSAEIDSPVDISLGLSFIKNKADLFLSDDSIVQSIYGDVAVLTQSINSIRSQITGGSVIKPKVNLGEDITAGTDATIEAPLDANNIVNAGISIFYSDVQVNSSIHGKVSGRHVNIAAKSIVNAQANMVTADNGYATFDEESAVKDRLKADASRTGTATRKVKEWLLGLVDKVKGKADEQTKESLPIEEEESEKPKNQKIGFAGAVAITVADYSVFQHIGAGSLIESVDPDSTDKPALKVSAQHHSGVIHNSANAGVHGGRKNAVALAVAISVLNKSVDVDVADGATLKVLQGENSPSAGENDSNSLVILAETVIESPFSLGSGLNEYGYNLFGEADPLKIIDEPEGFIKQFSPIEMGKKTVTRLIQNGNLISTNWANGYVVPGDVEKDETKNTDDSAPTTDVAIGGSFGFLYGSNTANVTIGAANIEVLGGDSEGRTGIDLSAKSWAHTILAAGTIAPPEFAGDESGTLELGDIFNGESAGTGIGGAINLSFFENEAHVNVLDGARLTTSGDLTANAQSHYETVLIQVAGGKAKDVAISGAFGLNWLDLHSSSLVADGAFLSVRDLDISAVTNMPGNLVISGGVAFSEATGIGAGAAINRVKRSTIAVLGYQGEGDQVEAGGSVEARDVRVNATTAGFMTGIGVAGAIQTPGSFGGDEETTEKTDVGDDDADHKSSGGLGISGSVTVNLSTSETLARARLPRSNLSGVLGVYSIDAVDITGISGAAALTVTGGTAVAGAASINRIESMTNAELFDTQADKLRGLTVDATSIGRIQGFSAAMAVTTEIAGPGEGDTVEFAAAGSFVYNDIKKDTNSQILASRILLLARPKDDDEKESESEREERDAVRVAATDGSRIFAVAGALAVDATSGGKAAIGAGVAVNLMQGAVQASIDNSFISGDQPGVLGVGVAANRIAPIYAFGIAGAAGTSKMAAAASVGINIIDSKEGKGTFASINDSVIDNVAQAVVQSASESQIISVAGAVAATSGNVAVGGSISINEIGSTVSAQMVDATVTTRDGIGIYASTASAIQGPDPKDKTPFDPDLSKEALKKTGVDIFNYYTDPVGTLLANRESSAAPDVVPIKTMNFISGTAGIYSAAVAGGFSSNVAVFGAFTANIITNDVIGAIRGSTVNVGKDISVLANNGAEIYSASGSVAISAGTSSVGGAATYNTLRGNTLAQIEDTTGTIAGELTVLADRSGAINTLSAAMSVASSTGLQGSAAISTFADRTEARLSGVDLTAKTVNLDTNSTLSSITAAGGIAGAGTFSFGGSAAILVSENINQATVNSSATRNSRINVHDALNINANNAEVHNSIAMTQSLSAYPGIAGSAGVKVMNGQTHARIGNNSLIRNIGNGDISLKAQSKLYASGEAGAVGGGLKAGLGVGLDLIVANGQTTATIGDNAKVRGTNIRVEAESEQDFASLSVAAGVGLVGIAGGVSIVHVGGGSLNSVAEEALGQKTYIDAEGEERQEGDFFAFSRRRLDNQYSGASVEFTPVPLIDGNTLASIGASDVSANNNLSVRAFATHDVDMTSGSGAGGAVGVGAGISVLSYKSHTAAVTNNARLLAGGHIDVTALDQDISNYQAYWQITHQGKDPGTDIALTEGDWFAINAVAGSAGLVGLGAAIAVVNRDNTTHAEIRDGKTNADGRILIDSQRQRHTRINALGAQVGGVTLGVSIGTLNEGGVVLASAGGSIGEESGDISIDELTVSSNADNRSVIRVNASAAGVYNGSSAVGDLSGAAVDSKAIIANNANIFLGRPFNRDAFKDSKRGNLNINAEGTNRNYLEVSTAGISTIATVGAAIAKVKSTAATQARIGDGADVMVIGHIRQESNLHTGMFEGAVWTPYSRVVAVGASASANYGFSIINAESDQKLTSLVDVGDNASVNASEGYWFDSKLIHHTSVEVKGGSVSSITATGILKAENNDKTDVRAEIGENTSVSAFSFSSLLRNISFYKSKTVALVGSIWNANIIQTSRLNNDSTSSNFNIKTGAYLTAKRDVEIDIASNFIGSVNVESASGGASAINNLNSEINSNEIVALVKFDGATIKAGQELLIRSNTLQSINADFDAFALGFGAIVNVNIDSRVDGYGEIHLLNGASLTASTVEMLVGNRQNKYSVIGKASAVGAGALARASVNNNLQMDSKITTENGTHIYGADINLVLNNNEKTRHSSIEAELVNASFSAFLSFENVVDNQKHSKEINLNGDIFSTSRFGRSVDVETFGHHVFVNGLVQNELNIAEEGDEVLLGSIAPQGSGKIIINVGDGLVKGKGVIRNVSHYLTDVTIRARNSVRVSDISLIGDPSALDIEIISGNNYKEIVENAAAPSGGMIRFDVGNNLKIEGIIDAAEGGIAVDASTNNQSGNISGNGVLRANYVNLNASGQSKIGSKELSLNIHLLETVSVNPQFEAYAMNGIFASLSIEGSKESLTTVQFLEPDNQRPAQSIPLALSPYSAIIDRAVIGNVHSNGIINLDFLKGTRADGRSAMAIYEIQGHVTSRGPVTLNATSALTRLVLEGEVRSGPAEGESDIYINILDENKIDTNWEGFEAYFNTGSINKLTLGSIENQPAGVYINAKNLWGRGLVYGNSSGQNISVNNQWVDLDILRIGKISLGSEKIDAVSINGNTSVGSNEYDEIKIQKIEAAGSKNINITDHWSSQLVVTDKIETDGEISINMNQVHSVSANNLGLFTEPVLKANAIDLHFMGLGEDNNGSRIGFHGSPILVDVGAKGLDIHANGRVNIKAVSNDLVLRGIYNQADLLNTGASSSTIFEASDGSIIALNEGGYIGNSLVLRGAEDINFSNIEINDFKSVSVSGNNIWWHSESDINMVASDARGDLNLVAKNGSIKLQDTNVSGDLFVRDDEGFGILAGGVNVAGETYIISDSDVVVRGNFEDAFHLEGINGPGGHNWGFTQIFATGDLKLGNIKTGFKEQLDPSGSVLLVTSSGDIHQADGTKLSIHNNSLFKAGGDLLLNQNFNEFDRHEFLQIISDSALVNAASDVNLFQLQIAKDLEVKLSSGQLSQNGYIHVGGNTTLTTQNGAIELLHSSNNFSGLVSVNANIGSSGALSPLQLSNSGTLLLGDLELSGNMSLFSGSGSVIGHGVIKTTGFNRVSARSGSIILDNKLNQLGWFGGVASENVTLVSSDSLRVNPFEISGQLTLEADHIQFLERSTFDGDFMASSLAPTQNSAGSMSLTARVGPLGTGDEAVHESAQMLQHNRRFTVSGETLLSSPSTVHFDNAAFAGPVNINSRLGIINQREGDLILGDVNVWGFAASTNLADNSSITGIGSLQVDNQAWFLTRGDLNLLNPTNRLATMDIVSANNVVIRGESDLTLRSGAEFVWDVALDSLDIEIGGNFAVAPKAEMPGWAFTGIGTSADVVRVDGDLRIVAGGAFGNLRNGLLVREDAWLQTVVGDLNLDANLISFGGSLDLHAGRDLSVQFVSPFILPGTSQVFGNTANALTLNSLSAGRNANIEGLSITLGDVQVKDDLNLNTDFYALGTMPGFISINGLASVGGETNIRTIGDVHINNSLNNFTGNINVFDVNTMLDKSRDVGLRVNNGRRVVGPFWSRMAPANIYINDHNLVSLGNITLDSNLDIMAENILLNGSVQTSGNLSLIATSGTLSGEGQLLIGGDAFLSSKERMTLDGSFDIDGSLNLVGNGIHIDVDDFLVDSLNSTSDLHIKANSFTLAPTDINVQSTIHGETVIDVAGDLLLNGHFNGNGDITFKGDAVFTNQPFTVGGVLQGQAKSMSLISNSSLVLGKLDVRDDFILTVANGDISMEGQIISIGGNMSLTVEDQDLVFDSGQLELLEVGGDVNLTAQNVFISSNESLNLGSISATNINTGFVSISGADLTLENVHGTSVDLIAFDGNIQAGVTAGSSVDGHYRYDASGDIDVAMRAAKDRHPGGTITANGDNIKLDFSSGRFNTLRMGNITSKGDLWIDNKSTDSYADKTPRADGILNIGGNIFAGYNSALSSFEFINPENRISGSINFNVDQATVVSAQTIFLGDVNLKSASSYLNLIAHNGNIEYIGEGDFNFESADLSAAKGNIILPRLNQIYNGWRPGNFNITANNAWLQGSEVNTGLYAGNWTINGELLVDLSASTFVNADLEANGFMSSFRKDQLRVKGETTLMTNKQSGVLLDGHANRFLGPINIDAGFVVLNAGIDSDKLSGNYGDQQIQPDDQQIQPDDQQIQPDEVTDSDDDFWGTSNRLDVGTFNVKGSVDILVGHRGIIFNDAIDTGAITFWSTNNNLNAHVNVFAQHKENRIQAKPGGADISFIQSSVDYFVDRPYEADSGVFGDVHIVDSTDLTVNRLKSKNDVLLSSAGSISFVDVVDPIGVMPTIYSNIEVDNELILQSSANIVTAPATVKGGSILMLSGGDILLNGNLISQDHIILSADKNFHNFSGSSTPFTSANGRWLVYSTARINNSNSAGLNFDFEHYGLDFNFIDPLPSLLPIGNGMIYVDR